MNYDEMSLDELKDFAKQNDIRFGNISREKLIEKISEAMSDNSSKPMPDTAADEKKCETKGSLSSIMSVIDNIDESERGIAGNAAEILPMNTRIPVRSLTFGTLIYKSSLNNATFVWNKIGATIYMTVEEITQMNNQNEDFLREPMVVLLDDRAVKQFGLSSVYEDVAKINDLETVFKSDINNISKVIDDALKVNMRDILISKVRDMYRRKVLTDINIIKLLEKKLKFDLSDDN